ncbi:MAG TPA: inositol monophosphatase family protein [Solirubrobacteraceae bacterium]|nr:inositol monophosphatase family protein [Solirubrobacteraceae bacterium]
MSEEGTRGGSTPHAGADEDGLLALAIEAARIAGELLAERARHGFERHVASKSTPTDLVSEADLASQRAIRELLRERRPDDGFVGEEEGESEPGTSGLSWVVDPLDGTVNFLFDVPQWSVSIAVCDEHCDGDATIAGVVYDANRDELFCATRSGAALMRSRERGELVLDRRPGEDVSRERRTGEDAAPGGETLASAMVATGLSYDADVRRAQARVLERVIPRVRDIRRFGSAALDLCWTAAGRFDAYYERTVKQWDVAAGVLVCERAGLEIHELPAHEDLPWGILAAPPALAEPLLGLVGEP